MNKREIEELSNDFLVAFLEQNVYMFSVKEVNNKKETDAIRNELLKRLKSNIKLEQIEDKYIELISLNKIGSRIDGIMEMYLEICKIINPKE